MKNTILLFIFSLLSFLSTAREYPVIKNGQVDLSAVDFNKTNVIYLHGQWQFFWNKLLTPNDFKDSIPVNQTYLIDVPGNWSNKNYSFPAHGFATYKLSITLKNNTPYVLNIVGASTAYKIWINNYFAGEVGKVGKCKDCSSPITKQKFYIIPTDYSVPADSLREISLIIQVSNFELNKAGIRDNISIGVFDKAIESNNKAISYSTFVLGILLIMSFYYFTIFYFRKKELSSLFLGIYSAIMAVRSMTTEDRVILNFFPNISFSTMLRLEYLSAYANILFVILFFYYIYKQDFNKIVFRILVIINIIITSIILFFPLSVFVDLRDYFNLYLFLTGFFLTFILMIKVMIRKRPNALLAFTGLIVLFITGVADVIITIKMIPFPYVAPYGLVFFIITQSFIISGRFSNAFKQNEKLNEELNRQNKDLEKIVTERTKILNKQKQTIENAHKDITSSIEYAQTIQDALLPPTNILKTFFNDYFILLSPKEIVSGDFYFLHTDNNEIVIAVADCTGHGVPGAFMTILSISYLDEIIKHHKMTTPSIILEELRKKIIDVFDRQEYNNNGLDIGIGTLNKNSNILQFSGANNHLYIIRNNELLEFKSVHAPVGNYPKHYDFVNMEIELKDNDMLYLFSDGYVDQFGSDPVQKFSKKRFKSLLMKIHKYPAEIQKKMLLENINEWTGNQPRIDDILVMGIRWKQSNKT